jgi:hypothetical protein
MKKYSIITITVYLFCLTVSAQVKIIKQPVVQTQTIKIYTPKAFKNISVWGKKPWGHRLEIRIANNIFMQQDAAFRESNVHIGKIVFIYQYHPAQQGELYGHYDVKETTIDDDRDFEQAGRFYSTKTEGDYTVLRITQNGMQSSKLGYNIDAGYLAGNSAFKKGLVITGNTVLNGTIATPTTYAAEPVIITISKSNLQ